MPTVRNVPGLRETTRARFNFNRNARTVQLASGLLVIRVNVDIDVFQRAIPTTQVINSHGQLAGLAHQTAVSHVSELASAASAGLCFLLEKLGHIGRLESGANL